MENSLLNVAAGALVGQLKSPESFFSYGDFGLSPGVWELLSFYNQLPSPEFLG